MTVQKIIATAIYALGLLLAVGSLVSGVQGGLLGMLLGTVAAIAVWWIAVGFGVRMGLTPDAFLLSVKHSLGFGVDWDVPTEAATEDHPS